MSARRIRTVSLPAESIGRGRDALAPSDLTVRAWRDVVLRVWTRVDDHHVALVSAGVAYYALFAIFPALAALVSVYGLIADPADAGRQIATFRALPDAAHDLLLEQLARITGAPESSLGWGLVGSVLLSIYSATRGMGSLILAVNIAYGEKQMRGLIEAKLVGFAFTLGAILLAVLALAIVVGAPVVLRMLPLGAAATFALTLLPWVLLTGGFLAGLMLLYRYGPHRRRAKWRWVTPGAAGATVLWLVVSLSLSAYVARFGDYNEIYGSVGAVIILLLWFFATAHVVVLGAELNAAMEHQTSRDTTQGPEKPMGERGAYVADTVGEVPPSPLPAWLRRGSDAP